ncbi:MAG: MFS transporter [Clostridia bacterium]|nr:MFS transporter [Clostridia bacterium]
MLKQGFSRTKAACYAAYFTMSSVFSLPPLLFVTFHNTYGISYTLLGTLVLINFCTQMAVDLIFTFFTKYFNVHKVVKVMPVITTLGLSLYALAPVLFPNQVFVGLVIGTVLFSVSAGLSEVLLSPVIAAIPSKNPQRDMSMLHSLYAFGVLFVVLTSTLFFILFGRSNWMYLTLFFAALPLLAAALFALSPMPPLSLTDSGEAKGSGGRRRILGLFLCTTCIFFGSCAENVMSNWISGYMENALRIDKSVGDVLGVAMFAVLLGLSRILYAKYGKRIWRTLMTGMVGAAACYLIAGLCTHTVVALIACAMTGLFAAMLWPGSLILMEENLPGVGVAAYALMAAGGDLGASVAPQLMGIVVDRVAVNSLAAQLSAQTGLSPEQIGMKAGMLVSACFPILGIVVLMILRRFLKRNGDEAGPEA